MTTDPWQEPSSVAWANHVLETMVPAALADEIVRLPDGVNLASSEELAKRIKAMCKDLS